MKLSTAFLKAYVLVAQGEELYTCDAILKAHGGRAPGALLFYRSLFTPREDSPEHYWLRGTEMDGAEIRRWRLTALCLAAAVARSEGL